MRFLTTFQTLDFLDTLASLVTAFVLGTLIGAERQYRLRTAGLRTNVLVAISAAAHSAGTIRRCIVMLPLFDPNPGRFLPQVAARAHFR